MNKNSLNYILNAEAERLDERQRCLNVIDSVIDDYNKSPYKIEELSRSAVIALNKAKDRIEGGKK